MSTTNPTRKISRRHELREDKVITLYARALDLVERNRKVVLYGAAAIVIIVVSVVGLTWLTSSRNVTAAERMASAVRAWESGDYRTALEGTETFLGLADIVDDFGSTASGNLARYYAAEAHFRLGEYDQALELFRDYDKDSNHLGAAALAGEAAVLELKGEHAEAASVYRRAASIFESDVTSPAYLMKAGRAFEAAGHRDDAARVYREVRDDYPESEEARDIEFFLARVGGA